MGSKKIALSTTLIMALSSLSYALEDMKTIEVVNIATKTAKSIDGVVATVEVITQEQIEKMGVESLREIIERTPGINVQFGTFPSASSKSKSSLSIRGMSVNGTLFLLDGRRLAGEVANPYDLDRIPASVIQRIEVVKGPASSLYGADAVGGVINIITKRPDKDLKIDAGVRYGSNEDGDAQNTNLNLSLQGKNSKFGYSAYASMTTTTPYTQSDVADVWVPKPTPKGMQKQKPSKTGGPGPIPDMSSIKDSYIEDMTYREDSFVYTVGTRLSYDFTQDLVLGIDINYLKEEREGSYIGYFHPSNYKFRAGANIGKNIPVYNIPVSTKDENNRLDLSVDIAYALNDDLQLKARVYNSFYEKRNTTSAKHYLDMGYSNKGDSAHHGMNADVDLKVAELSATYLVTKSHLVTAGVEYRDEARNASVFKQSNEMSEKQVDYQSIYLQDEWEVSDKLDVIVGGRYDAISNAENKATFRLGGIYEFSKFAKARASFAQGYRTPDIREMYIYKQTPNGLHVGADVMGYDLKPESTNSFEVGLGGRSNKVTYDLVIFYNKVNDMISQVMGTYNEKAAYTFENIANANTKGMELSTTYMFTSSLIGRFFWTELRTKDEKTKRSLEFQPKRTVMAGLDFSPIKDFNLGVLVKHIGKQNYTHITNRGAPTEMRDPNALTNSFEIVNLTASYEINRYFEVYGGINNLFDEKVDDVLGSNVGRYYFAGIRANY